MAILEAAGLRKVYRGGDGSPIEVLAGVDFAVQRGEFVASVVLYTHSNRPISVEILAQVRSLSFGTAAAYSVLLLVLVLLITVGAGWLEGRVTEGERTINAA